jgi:hypothetical protein
MVITRCGFTSGNDWDTEIFVFGIVSGRPKLLAKLSSSDWNEPTWGITRRVANDGIEIKNGEIIVSYYAGGSHAEPAWIATAMFRWDGTRFKRIALDRKKFVG